MNRTELGRSGEARAAAYLEGMGYRVVERNARFPGGEIDLICQDGLTLVFVEVKARSGQGFGPAISAVDQRKRRKIRSMASDYAQFHAPSARLRFDVVTIDGEIIALHRGAF